MLSETLPCKRLVSSSKSDQSELASAFARPPEETQEAQCDTDSQIMHWLKRSNCGTFRVSQLSGLAAAFLVAASPQPADAGAVREFEALEPELAVYRQMHANALAETEGARCIGGDTAQPGTIKACSREIEQLGAVLKSNKSLLEKVAAIGAAAKSEKPGKKFGNRIKSTVTELKDGRRALAAALAARLATRGIAVATKGKNAQARKNCEKARKLANGAKDARVLELVKSCEKRLKSG